LSVVLRLPIEFEEYSACLTHIQENVIPGLCTQHCFNPVGASSASNDDRMMLLMISGGVVAEAA
jgi:hypothetical protein